MLRQCKGEKTFQHTRIEWVKNPDGSRGYTSNVISGCSRRCGYCYALKMSKRLAGRFGYPKEDPFKPTFHPNEMREWLTLKKPSRIFICSMGDFFDPQISNKIRRNVLDTISKLPQHTFIILTKQYGAVKGFDYPKNVWLGISVDSQFYAKHVRHLAEVDAAVKFVSFEPLLDSIRVDLAGIDWIIIGARTQPYRPPQCGWVVSLIQQAAKSGCKVFLKDNLKAIMSMDNQISVGFMQQLPE